MPKLGAKTKAHKIVIVHQARMENIKNIQLLCLTLCLLSVTTSCQPALEDFQPENDSLFKISFSYPDYWSWEKEEYPYHPIEPFEELPPAELISYCCVNYGSVEIDVSKPSNPQVKMQEWMDALLGAVTQSQI